MFDQGSELWLFIFAGSELAYGRCTPNEGFRCSVGPMEGQVVLPHRAPRDRRPKSCVLTSRKKSFFKKNVFQLSLLMVFRKLKHFKRYRNRIQSNMYIINIYNYKKLVCYCTYYSRLEPIVIWILDILQSQRRISKPRPPTSTATVNNIENNFPQIISYRFSKHIFCDN